MHKRTFVVVGGSIAGCAMAILLRRLGFKVHVLERSSGLVDKGAGITLPEAVVQQCIALDLFDARIDYLSVSSRFFACKDTTSLNEEKIFWQQPIKALTLNWGDIYQQLYRRASIEDYHLNSELKKIVQVGELYELTTANGNCYAADLIIAADGVDSTVRTLSSISTCPEYTGYIAWRGLIDETMVQKDMFLQHIPYYVFPNGHILLYRIPAKNNQGIVQTALNWVLYESCSANRLKELLTDKNKKQHSRSLPAGLLAKESLEYLHGFAKTSLPKTIAELICQTPNPFIQAVFDFQLPANLTQAILFTGDAALTLRPHSASGVLKALLAAIDFSQFIKDKKGDLLNGVQQWQREQQSSTDEEVCKAKNMGKALVTQTPDWSLMNQELMDRWWSGLMQGKNWYATGD